jgi:hypothetical protein
MEEDKKEGRQRRKDRKKNCFTGSMLECDIFLYSNLMYSRSPEVKESSLPLLIIDLSRLSVMSGLASNPANREIASSSGASEHQDIFFFDFFSIFF